VASKLKNTLLAKTIDLGIFVLWDFLYKQGFLFWGFFYWDFWVVPAEAGEAK